ncbi:hypothetical protein J2Z83_001480 [Virgibacillus natechei]|uniref:DUF1659 domain-containing protein n=1 Tax=Virgibacillus natechei TaxID=1216297 RepID=A0ABS4IEI5_9BACI|nr:DUF1659 domain-containing protein [Virgibacillus natechei]MBP1969376.1 hypothetical protein [Virgibacillus natechei]UZD12520.1 DUF1659 domain-containing protein [Virgibacillus natechei]
MAVADMISSTLRLVLYEGNDTITGDPIYKYKSFNNVKTEATPEQLLTIAQSISALQELSLYIIERRDNSELREAAGED